MDRVWVFLSWCYLIHTFISSTWYYLFDKCKGWNSSKCVPCMIGIIDVIGIMSVPGVTVTVTDVDSFIGTTDVIVTSGH